MEKFELRILNEVKFKVKCSAEISKRFQTSGDLDAEVEINSAWEIIRENIKMSAK
jgi:hypothetical protein